MLKENYYNIESYISVDRNIYSRSLKSFKFKDVLCDKHRTTNITEALFIEYTGCETTCNFCKSKRPMFNGFKRGYKKTCRKCSNLSKSYRKPLYKLVSGVESQFKHKLKYKHFKWAVKMYKEFGNTSVEYASYVESYINGVLSKGTIETFNEYIEYSNKLKEFGGVSTKEKLVYMYGEEDGLKRYKIYKGKHSGKGSLDFFIKKYGKESGTKKYEETCSKKDSSSLEFFVKKYGNEEGTKLYNENCQFQKVNMKLEYMTERYGEEDGLKRYNEMKKKIITNSDTTIMYYTTRGYSEDEAIELQSERQKTFSLEKCINKLGELDGTLRWSERQEKWQDTLNSKSDEEIQSINIRKNPGFEWFIDYMDFSVDDGIKFISNIDKDKFKEYSDIISNLSNIEYNKYKDQIDPNNLRGYSDDSKYHLDHKFSRFMGYVLEVPVDVLSCKNNLEIIPHIDNFRKGLRCSITLEELYKGNG